jgi:hypothetical protein
MVVELWMKRRGWKMGEWGRRGESVGCIEWRDGKGIKESEGEIRK